MNLVTIYPIYSDVKQKIVTKLSSEEIEEGIRRFSNDVNDSPDLYTVGNFLYFLKTNLDPDLQLITNQLTKLF